MKKTITKKIAAILAVMTMVTAGSAFAITANAASADTTTTSNFLAERRVHKFDLTDHEMTFKYMTDIDENVVNPYLLFGSSFRVGANSMFMTNDGKFSISLGVDKGEGFGGTYVYHGASEKIFLSYNDGFKATGYVTILNDGTRALGIPMNICGNIYTVYFAI